MILAALALLGLIIFYLGLKVQGLLLFFNISVPRFAGVIAAAALFGLCLFTRSALFTAVIYSGLFFALFDLLSLIGPIKPLLGKISLGGIVPIVLGLIITLLAVINVKNPVMTEYSLTVDKDFGALGGVKIAFLSDAHMGTSMDAEGFSLIVEEINRAEPDVICLLGDIFDESTSKEMRGQTIAAAAGFKAKYGVYYVSGNHDSRLEEGEATALKAAGIQSLDESVVLVDGSFYLAGRADGGHGGEVLRRDLKEILVDIDTSLPLILLDHRPGDYNEAREAGADVQLSGHTHGGQFFPFGGISALVNRVNYGHKNIDDFNIVVSSGLGVWGFNARTEKRCEWVLLNLGAAN